MKFAITIYNIQANIVMIIEIRVWVNYGDLILKELNEI
jgi:hypothetical protein